MVPGKTVLVIAVCVVALYAQNIHAEESSCQDNDWRETAEALIAEKVKLWNSADVNGLLEKFACKSMAFGNDLPDQNKKDLGGSVPDLIKLLPRITAEVIEAVQMSPTRAYELHLVQYYGPDGSLDVPNVREFNMWEFSNGKWQITTLMQNNKKVTTLLDGVWYIISVVKNIWQPM